LKIFLMSAGGAALAGVISLSCLPGRFQAAVRQASASAV
jgi:hypothetical protein